MRAGIGMVGTNRALAGAHSRMAECTLGVVAESTRLSAIRSGRQLSAVAMAGLAAVCPAIG